MTEEVVYQSPLMYRILRDDAGLVIEVVVGGIAMSTVRVRLSAEQALAYERDGSGFSDQLANAIMASPRSYQ
ncbi:hypothetical protein DB30_07504 [Enhygromyxa salina]|uniref:Uncharacterized protein n=1 Tax=Enhygromyxa salina TaxID=215803 RepID=A0A0C1Z881_9BACT|nr:hypothetical protein [Enhygromyxa salina]KIG13849.1 hypothetical protein DB30_07504 [Enhygromyxa salina]